MTLQTSLASARLIEYVSAQLNHFYPDKIAIDQLDDLFPDALRRLEICINSVRLWEFGQFNHLHSAQYCIFLYQLSRVAYESGLPSEICTKLFLLNKALNGIDLFYEIKMPERFFIGHTVGIVLSKASYGEYLVLYQNSTIGKNNGKAPTIGDGTIVFPNAAILGSSRTSSCTTISQGARLVDACTPQNSIVFNSFVNGSPVIKVAPRKYIDDYFRT